VTGVQTCALPICSETPLKELKHLSVISTVYRDGTHPVGVLGIIGPKRMEYPKMMALVGAVSKIVNKLLGKMS
jgi:heat-inducible transcriptional repressor